MLIHYDSVLFTFSRRKPNPLYNVLRLDDFSDKPTADVLAILANSLSLCHLWVLRSR